MTPSRLVAIATWRSTPSTTDSSGTMISPPPTPTSAPNSPGANGADEGEQFEGEHAARLSGLGAATIGLWRKLGPAGR